MTFLLIFVTAALLVMVITAISNVFVFPRLRRPEEFKNPPTVSILVPARNEAAVIGQTVKALLAQTYPHFELLILDDDSTDETAALARAAGRGDVRLRVLAGTPLPDGWMGKNHACYTLAQQARGCILVFTDADTQWQPTALAALISAMQARKADLTTVWPTQQTVTWAERLVVPLMMLAILGYLPIVMTHYSPLAVFAAANGQCMAWRRRAYFAINGHAAIADSVLDDVRLARIAKRHGFRLRMLDGAGLIACRMYSGWPSVRDGFAKNILAGYGGSVAALLLATIFHLLVFIMPYGWLLMPEYALWGACLIALGLGLRALTAAVTRQRLIDALLLPVSVVLMTVIAVQAIYWHFTGGARWKGRIITHSRRSAAHG